jgi:hypothetical protein
MVQGQPAAESQYAHLAQRGHRLQHGLVTRLHAYGPHLGPVEADRGPGQAGHLGVFLAERLDHADAVDVLVDDLGDITFLLLAVPGGREDLPAHTVGNEHEGGRHHQADDRQQRREVDHDGQGHPH